MMYRERQKGRNEERTKELICKEIRVREKRKFSDI
jgi:hypothetical protein